MNKKYELTDESITIVGYKLYRIKALRSFSNVREGDLGGYIEKESNLSHDGDCWIADNAWVFDNATVFGNAGVSDNARVYNTARVFGNAQVFDDASIFGNAQVSGNAQVFGDASVHGDSSAYGSARVSGYALVYGKSKISGNCILKINDWTYLYDINLDHGIWIDTIVIDDKEYILSDTLEQLYIGDDE
jgi:carbonic anhydrase/acetyltransferase-like protein (isoleucine patch superfamily)